MEREFFLIFYFVHQGLGTKWHFMFKATTSVTHTGGVEEEGEYEATDSALLLSTGQLGKQSNVIIHNSSFPIQCFCLTRMLSVAPFSPAILYVSLCCQ